jgi:hypothetical protein
MAIKPAAMLHQMVRLHSPDVQIVALTNDGRNFVLLRKGARPVAAICGVRIFNHSPMSAVFAAAGLIEIDLGVGGDGRSVRRSTTARGQQDLR